MISQSLPPYLIDRARRPPPPAGRVVPGSTPVVAFGNARRATVATLGLNPSRVEFLDRHGRELRDADRRLETLSSLGVAALQDAPGDAIARVVAGCDSYFQRNPYWRWFRPLENLLNGLGASYTDGSACHLDLMQWATDPTWRGLSQATRQSLLEADAAFLRDQLIREEIATVLLNGQSVIDSFAQAYGARLGRADQVSDGRVTAQLVAGRAFDGVVVVGWSTNLQSSFGVTKALREQLRQAVARIVSERIPPHIDHA